MKKFQNFSSFPTIYHMYLFGKRFVNCDTKSVRKFSRMYWKFTSGCRIAILQLVVELFYKYQHWLQHGYKWLGHDPELRRQVISFRQALVRKTAWLDVEFFEQDITEAHTNHSTIFVQRKCVDAIWLTGACNSSVAIANKHISGIFSCNRYVDHSFALYREEPATARNGWGSWAEDELV
jgi:hypothetical protein